MIPITLAAPGSEQTIGRQGPTLHVINHPFLDYQAALLSAVGIGAIYVLVGFDRTPTAGAHDAAVPPLSEALIAVPASVQVVHLAYGSVPGGDFAANVVYGAPGSEGAHLIWAEWLSCVVPTMIRPIDYRLPVQLSGTRLKNFRDSVGRYWPAGVTNGVLDQAALGTSQGPLTRPHISPSAVDTGQVTTAALTLVTLGTFMQQDFLNPTNNPTFTRVVHRIYVHVTNACTFVIGPTGLTVPGPSPNETGRLVFDGAGTLILDYGPEGLPIDVLAGAGPWKLFTSAITTVVLTVIGG